MADISEGVNIMKDNWEFDDLGDEILEEEDTMDGNKGKTEESAKDEAREKNLDTTNNPETGGILLFGVGGTRNENKQKEKN